MTFSEALEIIVDLPDSIAILLVGDAGIGKSSFARQLADILGLYLSEFNCSEAAELGDIIGLPDISGENTVFKPPKWFVRDRKTLMFLDEINRPGAQAIIKGMMGFALTKKLGDLQLAPGSRIIGAINPERDNIYDVLRLDPAQLDRFWICEIECDADEWIVNFAIPNHVNKTVINYISDNEADLHTLSNKKAFELARESRKYTGVLSTPRSWEACSKTLNNMEKNHRFDLSTELGRENAKARINRMACGFIGVPLAEKFSKYYVNNERIVRARDIMEATPADWTILGPQIIELCKPEKLFIGKSLCENVYGYVKKHYMSMFKDASCKSLTEKAYLYGENFNKFINICHAELVADMYYRCIKPDSDSAPWMNAIGTACPESMTKLESILKAAVRRKRIDDADNQTTTLTPSHRKMPNPKQASSGLSAGEEFTRKAREAYDRFMTGGSKITY